MQINSAGYMQVTGVDNTHYIMIPIKKLHQAMTPLHKETPPLLPLPRSRRSPCCPIVCGIISGLVFLTLGITNIREGNHLDDGQRIVLGGIFVSAASTIFIGICAVAIQSYLDKKRDLAYENNYTLFV